MEAPLEIQEQPVSSPDPAQAVVLVDPAPAPRAITPRVRWRSWLEPRVRFWWVVAAFFFLVSVYFFGHGFYTWQHENWLLRDGTPIGANVDEVGAGGNETGGINGKRQPPDGRVIAHFTVDGNVHSIVGWLKGRTEWIVIGADVPIHFNPSDPDDWTGITSPIRLIDEDDVVHGLGVCRSRWSSRQRRYCGGVGCCDYGGAETLSRRR